MNLDYNSTKDLTESLVREYLSRKGLKNTFSVFEKELPRTSLSIGSRTALIKSLHLKHKIKQNKESSNPFCTLLEVLVNYYLVKYKGIDSQKDIFIHQSGKSQLESEKPAKLDSQNNDLTENFLILSSNMDSQKRKGHSSHEKKKAEHAIETHDAAPVGRFHRTNLIRQECAAMLETEKNINELKLDTNSNVAEDTNKDVAAVERPKISSSSSKISKKTKVLQSNRKKRHVKKFNDLEIEDLDDFETEGKAVGSGEQLLTHHQKYQSCSVPITLKQAVEMRHLIFGSESTTFSYEWMKQDFSFNNNRKVYYGLVQHCGGPCGVLAAIQAYVIRYLFFCTEDLNGKNMQTKRDEALINAIAHILYKAGEMKKCFLALPSTRQKFTTAGKFKSDGLMEYLSVYEFMDYSQLLSCLKDNFVEIKNGKSGCVLILYSVILSRGIKRIQNDMDDPHNHLIGAHGYCSQEMVNLLLTGKASSNIFNDLIELDSGTSEKSILKGIFAQSEIGFLSLFEHYNSCEVGSYFKSPTYPIWVVCSESHFSVLFGKNPKLDEYHKNKFDLYYYDGLAQQDGEIKLTVDQRIPPSYSDLVPPLDDCIRTKWKNASIDWNGYDPIL